MHFASARNPTGAPDMFERYTEKARRTIFFARYEATQVRSPIIDTEHLLLGLIREEKSMFVTFLNAGAIDEIVREIRALTPPDVQPLNTSVDLPVSEDARRVFSYASEEAQALDHHHIGTEHLFLGLLRDQNTLAGQLLRKYGGDVSSARELMGKEAYRFSEGVNESPLSSRYDPSGTVRIHGERLNLAYIESLAVPLRRFAWVKQDWQPRDLLIEKTTGRVMFYSGQQFDAERFELAKGAWPRDHCALCRWELNRSSPEHQTAYTNGMEWVCPECYERFVAPHLDPGDEVYT